MQELASIFLCAHNDFKDFNTSLVNILYATVSDVKPNLTTTCNTEITSSDPADFKTLSIGCIMSDLINCIATETSLARAVRAEQACSTLRKRKGKRTAKVGKEGEIR